MYMKQKYHTDILLLPDLLKNLFCRNFCLKFIISRLVHDYKRSYIIQNDFLFRKLSTDWAEFWQSYQKLLAGKVEPDERTEYHCSGKLKEIKPNY